MEERRKDQKELMFMMGEVYTQCKRIPVIEDKIEKQDEKISGQDNKIDACKNKSKILHASNSFIGGMFGGFIAVLGKKFLVG